MSHEHNDVTAHNRETWDSEAKDYDAKPWQKKIAAQVASALDSHVPWLGANWTSSSNQECRLLDYACGTGSVTRMLEQYKTLLSSSHPSLHLNTAIADLCSNDTETNAAISGPGFYDFDVAGVALGFHHFNNPSLCISNLAKRLKKGGVLFIVDWLPKDVKPEEHIGSQHAHPSSDGKETDTEEWKKMQKTIKTNGFTENDMRNFFEGAGFEEFGFVVLEESFVLQMNGKEVKKTGFIAKGRKV
ncbi:S-adenosyl-L-methionine-dependent methyltransferase, partial [Aureobasidium melanogenum]